MQKIADILCYTGKHPYQFIRPPNTQALVTAS
jgi:hypothetical protein